MERISDFIVQRDNAYDQKLIKVALESDSNITKVRKQRDELLTYKITEIELQTKNHQHEKETKDKYKELSSDYYNKMRKKVKAKQETT